MVELGITEAIGGLRVYGADLPKGIESAVVKHDGRSVVLLDSSLGPVGRDVALFVCLASMGDDVKGKFSAT